MKNNIERSLPPDFVLVVPSETLLREHHPLSGEAKNNFMILYLFSASYFCLKDIILIFIKLLESPIPATATAATSSQKAHFDNISGTKRGTIDPLVSKRPEKNSE